MSNFSHVFTFFPLRHKATKLSNAESVSSSADMQEEFQTCDLDKNFPSGDRGIRIVPP
jgi:hypothetical protein